MTPDQYSRLAHLQDKAEIQRTRVLRKLLRIEELLNDGLLSLNRNPTKTTTIIDHAERALALAKEEIETLQKYV